MSEHPGLQLHSSYLSGSLQPPSASSRAPRALRAGEHGGGERSDLTRPHPRLMTLRHCSIARDIIIHFKIVIVYLNSNPAEPPVLYLATYQ